MLVEERRGIEDVKRGSSVGDFDDIELGLLGENEIYMRCDEGVCAAED